MVRPVDADVVDLVLAVAQLYNTVDDAPRVGRQCGLCGLVRRGSADDGAGPLLVARRDLTDLLRRRWRTTLEGNRLRRRLGPAVCRLHDDLRGRDRCAVGCS